VTGLAGRSIVVSGAASGIGQAIARSCLIDGAFVIGLDVDEAGLTSSGATAPNRFTGLPVDVTDPASVAAAGRKVAADFGPVHGLVTAAGIGGYTGDVVHTAEADWARTLAVNLTGVYLVSKAFLPALSSADWASVVHISSQYGMVGGAGSPAYCAAKAGVIGLTRAMAVDHAGDRVRVNCVCPGPTDTPMLRRSTASGPSAAREEARVAGRSLLPAPGRAADVAELVGFLLGPGSQNITGAILPVDGGWTAS